MHSTVRPAADRTSYAETAVQKVALVFGIVFAVIGIAGFIPGLTTNLETIQFAGAAMIVLGILLGRRDRGVRRPTGTTGVAGTAR